jgi:hypothetical protein
MSMGASQLSDGDRLTSSSQGLRSESMRMSNPYSSKQFLLCGTNILHALFTGNSTEIIL